MSLFNRNKQSVAVNGTNPMADLILATIHEGVIVVDNQGIVRYANPAAASMTNFDAASSMVGLSYDSVIRLESSDGRELSGNENQFMLSMQQGKPLDNFVGILIVPNSSKRVPVAISVIIMNHAEMYRIVTFRNVAKELAEENEKIEFVSTASHEMRTPVASIEGYLALALNPQTASIDARARSYLESAHVASQHLGKLFRDLLDATKLDEHRIHPNLEPVEMTGVTKQICDDYIMAAQNAKLSFQFGANKESSISNVHKINQLVYSYVDVNFLREIMGNLIENAIKYTSAGGSIYVNVLGDGDRALINVTDTGIGISPDDIQHIFQKFYRADNSETRTIGGTGLGLYLVKQRVEAMGGRVWAESAFGEGSTFYVSLPRITGEEYEKRMIALRNQQMVQSLSPPTDPQQVAMGDTNIASATNNINNMNGGTK